MPPKPPFINPNITDPNALRYQEMLRNSMQDNPVGISPSVPIPQLDKNLPEGFTPAQVAMMNRAQVTNSTGNPTVAGGGIFGPQAQAAGYQTPQVMPGIQPSDLLPEEAQLDPSFARNAAGNMYAMYQPHLAMRYGVVRNGLRLPPQALQPPAANGAPDQGRFKASTIESVNELNQFLASSQKATSIDPSVIEAAADSAAGAAAAMGNAPGDRSSEPISDDEKDKVRRTLEGMDDLDFYQFRQMMVRDVLNNKEQQKIIEERLQPLDITSLVMTYTLSQVVPIIPGSFEPEFEVVSLETELALKAMIARESRSMDVSEQYYLDKYGMFAIAAGLKAINKMPLTVYMDEHGFNEEKFNERLRKVLRFPLPMMASLGVNYFWFDIRVRKLFSAEKVKNG